jgi:hypothetical protein
MKDALAKLKVQVINSLNEDLTKTKTTNRTRG